MTENADIASGIYAENEAFDACTVAFVLCRDNDVDKTVENESPSPSALRVSVTIELGLLKAVGNFETTVRVDCIVYKIIWFL